MILARSRSPGRSSRWCPRRTAACACQRDDWPRQRARRCQRVADAPRRPTGHAPRPGRCRQDPPGARGRAGGGGSLPGGVGHLNLDGVKDAGVLVPGAAAALGVVAATAGELVEQLGRAARRAPRCWSWTASSPSSRTPSWWGKLLTAAANLSVLATSRAALRLSAEHIYRVQPLTPPNAAALLVERASALRGLGSRRRDRRRDLRPPGRPAAGDRVGGGPGRMLPPGPCSRASSAGSSCSPVGRGPPGARGRSERRWSGRGMRRAASRCCSAG